MNSPFSEAQKTAAAAPKRAGRFSAFFRSESFHNYRRSPGALIGSLLMAFILLVALLGPLFTPQNPYDLAAISLSDAYKPPCLAEGGELPFILGTDQQGRDILSAIVYGSRVSLTIGFLGALCAGGLGITLGLTAGYFGGRVDALIMRLADVQLSFPSMLIALLLMSLFEQGVGSILAALTAVGWVRYARTVRGEVLLVKKKEYVEATRVIGLPHSRVLMRHVLPNALTSVIVLSTIQIGSFILTEATLSFLGLGVPITRPSLGMLCSNGFKVLYSGLWWVSLFPGFYIMLIVFAINLLGDFLRDEFNPKLK